MNESTTKRLLTNEGVTGTLYVSAFCIVIALFLFGFGIARPFVPTLVISLAIGLSILWLSELFAPILEAYVSPTTASVVLTPVGLVLGLGVAGLINEFSVFAYFTTDNAALMLGIFFAMLGYLVFQSRSHLARVEAKLANAAVLQEQQQRTLKTSELKLLQAQIEPHFLFNTLSNIVGLVHTNPDGAEKALINLTTLLRSSLDQTRQSSTSLKEELALVDAYLAIQTIRMPNRLSYRFDPPIRALP